MEDIRILLLGVSFRVYISYKIPRPHGTYTHTSIKVKKSGKVEMAETREVRRGFTFLTDFSKKMS